MVLSCPSCSRLDGRLRFLRRSEENGFAARPGRSLADVLEMEHSLGIFLLAHHKSAVGYLMFFQPIWTLQAEFNKKLIVVVLQRFKQAMPSASKSLSLQNTSIEMYVPKGHQLDHEQAEEGL